MSADERLMVPSDAPQLRFEVHDDGCGLPPSASPCNIFHRYAPGSLASGNVPMAIMSSPEVTPETTPITSPEQGVSAASVTGGAAALEAAVEDARTGLEKALSVSTDRHGAGLGIGLNLTYSLVRAFSLSNVPSPQSLPHSTLPRSPLLPPLNAQQRPCLSGACPRR